MGPKERPVASPNAAPGTPDWQGLLKTECYDLLPAFQDPQLFFVLPKLARLATTNDGMPDFFLEFFSDSNDHNVDNSLYAMLHMGFEIDNSLSDARAGLPARTTLLPFTFTTGTYVHMESGDSRASLPFAWESARRASMDARVSLLTARLLYGALAADGMTPMRAAIECAVPALLPRPELSVRGNLAQLRRAACDALRAPDGCLPFAALADFFSQPRRGLLQYDADASPGADLGLAIAGRVYHALGRFAPCKRLSDGPHIYLDIPAQGAAADMSWDLRTPLLATIPVLLRYDPFRFLTPGISRDRLTAFTRIPSLPDELRTRRITIASGLPANIVNCAQAGLSLLVEKDVAESGMTTVYSVEVYPAERRSATLELRYAKTGTAKPYRVLPQLVRDDEVVTGTPFDGATDFLLVEPGLFAVQCLMFRASESLLGEAEITIAFSGDAALASLSATLTAASPSAAFLVDPPAPGASCVICARDRKSQADAVQLSLSCRSAELEQAAFPQYGPQAVHVSVLFESDTTLVRLEFQPEAFDTAPVLLEFFPARPSGQYNYFSNSIFHHRYRYRRTGATATADCPWSAPLLPGQDLIIHA